MGTHEDERRRNTFAPQRSTTVRLGLLLAVAGVVGLLTGETNGGEPGVAARYAPWAVRIGLSLAGGYLVGWLFRRARAKALAVAGVGVAAVAALKYFGVLDDPEMTARLEELAASAADGANRVKDWVYSVLPDGFAAGAGAFLGLRSDPEED